MTRLREAIATPELVLGLLAVGAFIALSVAEGGSAVTASSPAGLFFLGLLAIGMVLRARQGEPPPPRLTLAAFGFLAAYTIWGFLSISWAEAQGPAWDGANRTLVYLTVFALFALPRWRAEHASILLGTYAVGLAAVALLALAGTAASAEPETALVAGRFSEPVGYHNAVAALFLAAAWPAAYLASRREIHPALRGLCLAGAGILVQVALIPQSRGSAVALPVAAVIYAVLVPGRVRGILTLVPIAIATLLAADPLLDVYGAVLSGSAGIGLDAALDEALRAVALSGLSLFLLGIAAGVLDRRVATRLTLIRRVRLAGGVAILAATLATCVAVLVAIGNPVEWADDRWQELKAGGTEELDGSSRFSDGLGSQRYDFWRVAADSFEAHPVGGIGSENFAIDYLRERRSDQEPLHPHSLELRVLSQTGIVGAALFVGFLGFALAAAAATRYRDRLAAGGAAVAVVAASYWIVHGSGDWFFELPALAAPAFAWLGVAGRIHGSALASPEPGSPRHRKLATAALALVGLLVAASYVAPWGAARDVELAAQNWRTSSESAYGRIDRDLDLNPLSDEAALVGGAIASRRAEYDLMRRYFEIALDRNPSNWYAHLELGALDALEGDRAQSLERLSASRELNPGEPVTTDVIKRVRGGRQISLGAIDRAFLQRVCDRIGTTGAASHCD
ncbi:MAG: O-antigen ligase family protein [Actinomycetota bacterium]|nr:O-antigen ligase family protein [Actinomycetota bacterium]